MNHPVKLNALPIVEEDAVLLLDHDAKTIKIGTTLVGEINHIPTGATCEGSFY